MKKDVATSGWSYEMTFRYTGPPVDPAATKPHEPVTTPSKAAPAKEPSKPTNPARPLQGQLRTGLPAISLHLPGTRPDHGLGPANQGAFGKAGAGVALFAELRNDRADERQALVVSRT